MKNELILNDMIRRYPCLDITRKDILNVFNCIVKCFKNKGRLFVFGNGGSAADSLHFVGELMKSFVLKREIEGEFRSRFFELYPEDTDVLDCIEGALPAYALVENTALSTAFANDVNSEITFAQQIYGYSNECDIAMGISASGNSRNVINAVKVAKAKNAAVVGLSGGSGGKLKLLCDFCIVVPEIETYKIQELHLPVYHALALMLEEEFFG